MPRSLGQLNSLHLVGLEAEHLNRWPHAFSGGQRQRIGIARALSLNPECIICDEPVSALDVSVQAQVMNLLMDLQRERGLSLLFIAHDLAVVGHLCQRVAVLYGGELVEIGPSADVLNAPYIHIRNRSCRRFHQTTHRSGDNDGKRRSHRPTSPDARAPSDIVIAFPTTPQPLPTKAMAGNR